MMILWEAGEPLSRSEIEVKLSETKKLSRTTVFSFLSRLEDKEFLRVEQQGKKNIYIPLVEKKDYLEFEGDTMLKKMFGSSLKNFVASMCDGKAVSKDELQELKAFIVNYEDEEV